MATYTAVFSPKSGVGAISANQQVLNLAATTASSSLTVGKFQKLALSVVPGSTAITVSQGVGVRLSSGASAGLSTDFILPMSTVTTVDTGAEYDTVTFFNLNATGTVTCSVWTLGNG